MAPEMDNPVVASSNNDTVSNLKSKEDPHWESTLGDDSPTVTVTVSEIEDVYISEVFVKDTENVDNITVKVVDLDDNEVRIKHFMSESFDCSYLNFVSNNNFSFLY